MDRMSRLLSSLLLSLRSFRAMAATGEPPVAAAGFGHGRS